MTSGGDPDLAAVGRLLADPTRCAILLALDDGRALPSSALARAAHVAASTASEHLGILRTGGLVAVESHGRHRYYRLAGPEVGQLIERMGALAPTTPVRSLGAERRAEALRDARSCYDHLAGRLGVALMDRFVDRGWITATASPAGGADSIVGFGHELDYTVTASGHDLIERLGIRLAPRRTAVRYCIDWTEQRHHLAGALGAGLLDAFTRRGWVSRASSDRAVRLTPEGRQALHDVFGLSPEVREVPARPSVVPGGA